MEKERRAVSGKLSNCKLSIFLFEHHMKREIHPELFQKLTIYEEPLVELFLDLRDFVFSVFPDSNELLYHTHALTSVFTPTLKMGDGFCHIPIYTNHFNLGFNKGTLIDDPHSLLTGTGNLIRHIPITKISDFKNENVRALIKCAVDLSLEDAKEKDIVKGQTVCKYKK